MSAQRPGFTLTELLVTVAIIAVLAGIAVPVFNGVRKKADRAACFNNLREIGVGLELYLRDHNGRMPNVSFSDQDLEEEEQPFHVLLGPYIDDPKIFRCPADDRIYEEQGSSYFYNSTVANQHRSRLNFLGSSDDLTSIPLVSDAEAFHGEKNGTNILYADYGSSNEVRFRVSN